MKVVVMIPALNEAKTIEQVVKSIPRDFADVKVLVIDDGSRDNTSQLAKKAGADKVVRHGINRGLGTAFKTGINTALHMKADVIVNIDADGQFNANDIPRLVQPIIDNRADMVTCTRFKDPRLLPKMPLIKIWGNKFFTKVINVLTKHRFTDTQCGFRAYSQEAALRMNLFGRFTYTQEVFLDLVSRGMRIAEVPCKVKGQRDGKSRIVKNVWSYGIQAMLIIMRTIRDHHALRFFGLTGGAMFSVGFIIGLFIAARWLFLGRVDPYMAFVVFSLILLILGFLMIMLGLIADMLERTRKNQDEILYRLKKDR